MGYQSVFALISHHSYFRHPANWSAKLHHKKRKNKYRGNWNRIKNKGLCARCNVSHNNSRNSIRSFRDESIITIVESGKQNGIWRFRTSDKKSVTIPFKYLFGGDKSFGRSAGVIYENKNKKNKSWEKDMKMFCFHVVNEKFIVSGWDLEKP